MKITKSETITTYEVAQSDKIFNHIETLLIAIQGVAVSCELFTSGENNFNPGDYVSVCALHLPKEVRLPLYGPIQAALINRKADLVEIRVSDTTPPPKFNHETSGLQRFVRSIFIPFLVSYHEENIGAIRTNHSTDRTKWPDAWQMSWALRNAASHNGKVFISPTQQPVKWEGICFSPADDATSSILNLVNGGDILILMLEMELELSKI